MALSKGDLAAAARSFDAAAKAAPKAPGPLIGLAEVAMRRGMPANAKRDLRKAFKLATKDAFVRSACAHYLLSRKRYGEAIAEFGKV